MITKLLGPEIDIGTTANTIANSTLVRVVNGNAPGTLTVQFTNGAVYGTMTMPANCIEIVQKKPTHMVIGTGMKATPIAYKG